MAFYISELNLNSVETLPGFEARAAFTVNSASVFREDIDIVPIIVNERLSYMPWVGNNQLPFNIFDLIKKGIIDLWSICSAKTSANSSMPSRSVLPCG